MDSFLRSLATTLLASLATAATVCSAAQAPSARGVLNFNPDWRFVKDDPARASAATFDDSSWKLVSAPHTFNDEDTFDDWSVRGHRGEQNQWSGRTWYRKTFATPATWRGKKVFIEFEAARQIAEVYLNGTLLGVAKSGFTPFGFDLTPHLRSDGAPNVLAVMCDNRFMRDPDEPPPANGADRTGSLHQMLEKLNVAIPEDIAALQADQIPWNNPHWHPPHGGLYRNVRLYVTDPLHITLPLFSFLETAGPYAFANEISARSAKIGVTVPVRNDRGGRADVAVRAEIFDANGKLALTLDQRRIIEPGATAEISLSGALANPHLWEPDYPHVYRVVCSLSVGGALIDNTEVPLGIRTVRWDAAQGFFINGRHVKLHGWGQKPTDEWPGLGAAQPDWMHAFTLQLMRDAGGNFVRWGHCPGGPASIAAADRLGIVTLQPGVDGEGDAPAAAWKLRAATFRDTIIYFRNNPSILIWEGGNQKVSREHVVELRGYMDKYDPHGGRAYAHRRADQITAEFMDLGIGTEGGREISYLPVVEGEYDREESPRRVWDAFSPPNFGYPEAAGQTYQLTSEQFAVNEVEHWLKKLSPAEHSGGANWIFSDSTSGGRVAVEVARASGEVDGVRLPKEAYFVCAAIFIEQPRVHIVGHWTYPAATKKTIFVVANANADEVELSVNGKSLGRAKPTKPFLFTFADVAFAPGEIKATAFRGGKVLATQTKRTAGKPVALRMTPLLGPAGFRADGSDVALVDVEAIDAKGNRCPTFQARVDFELEGPAVWRGGYNSGKIGSTNNTFLDLEAGINRVAVRASRKHGKIVVRARTEGLPTASVTIALGDFSVRDGSSTTLPATPVVALPAKLPDWSALRTPLPALVKSAAGAERMAGRFTKTFSYSAPNMALVHVDTNAAAGKNAYVDMESPFSALPSSLVGADWIKVANRDALYDAVDLIELAVPAGVTITLAHDDRLARPAWLTSQFEPTDERIVVLGQAMSLFRRRATAAQSVTLGANTESSGIAAPNMYLVFVNGDAVAR